ncbi:hypothetical protein [Chryseobacterium chendengshani]|uniref:hypothetical protein n=1 Tax=Chryseobacterium sp. LJ756 TaxID=2864113 RepID=UPI001C63FE5E|nr:hypothetical protein [Chryseobacterium sp. LJ756]MBW7675632.1 hypothetical protein [Chryseobacterium sp. LJ756]
MTLSLLSSSSRSSCVLSLASLTIDLSPDYYYFNGKSISEKKFEKLKEENPNYQYFFFKNKEASRS